MTGPMLLQFVRLCSCGCGQPTKVWPENARTEGRVKGQPAEWIARHSAKAKHRDMVTPDLWTVQANGCWFANNKPGTTGYSEIKIAGRSRKAHIHVFEHYRGPVPPGLQLDHLCRNRRCVNPDHLEPVTPAENVRRGLRAKLTVESAREIRQSPEATRVLVARYGVSRATIQKVRAGTAWAEEQAS